MQNEYVELYCSIITHRKLNPAPLGMYTERHHIVPKCLAQLYPWINVESPDNLVDLTAQEHFECHRLLSLMFDEGTEEWRKMHLAFSNMIWRCSSNQKRSYQISPEEYERVRIASSKISSIIGKANLGKRRTPEQRKSLSEKMKGKPQRKRGPLSLEKKLMYSQSLKGVNTWSAGRSLSEEHKKRIGESAIGRKHSEKDKQRMSEIKKQYWADVKSGKIQRRVSC